MRARLVAQSCLTLCDPMNCSLPAFSVHGDSPGKNTRVGHHALLQGIFPTQGSNPGLLHCRRIVYPLSQQGSPSGRLYAELKKIESFGDEWEGDNGLEKTTAIESHTFP